MGDETQEVLAEVRAERDAQTRKWGLQNHTPAIWLAILGEEVGEANKAFLEAATEQYTQLDAAALRATYREELIQVAAVAVAMVESFDRNEGRT